jgi:hypothetical protein
MPRIARLCPSTNNWTGPSGGWKGPAGTTFPAKYGFGFDEWLNANQVMNLFPEWMTENVTYCIAFIQAYKKQRPGFCAPVELFIIDQNHERLVVGTLKSCRRLSTAESDQAFNFFSKNGVLAAMQGQITPVPAPYWPRLGVHPPLTSLAQHTQEMFNCCFQLSELTLLATARHPAIHNYRKYNNLKRYSSLYR